LIQEQYNLSLQSLTGSQESIQAGLAFGAGIADQIRALRANDGSDNNTDYTPPSDGLPGYVWMPAESGPICAAGRSRQTILRDNRSRQRRSACSCRRLRHWAWNALHRPPCSLSSNIRWCTTATTACRGSTASVASTSRCAAHARHLDWRAWRHGCGPGTTANEPFAIVQRHGGQVTVRSQLGIGSEFICEFPPN
jgi:hypothetical protein